MKLFNGISAFFCFYFVPSVPITESCLFLPNVTATQTSSRQTCQDYGGQLITVKHITTNEKLKNMTLDKVQKLKINLWTDIRKDVNGTYTCTAFVWTGIEVAIDQNLVCDKELYPACVLDTASKLCQAHTKKHIQNIVNRKMDDHATNGVMIAVIIASVCGGFAGLAVIVVFIGYLLRKYRETACESLEETSFELKRYRVSEGFNSPVISDEEWKREETDIHRRHMELDIFNDVDHKQYETRV